MVGTVYKKRRKSLYDNGIQLLPTVRNAEVEGSTPFRSIHFHFLSRCRNGVAVQGHVLI